MTRKQWFGVLLCALGAIFYCYEYYLRVSMGVMRPELMQAYNLSDAGFGVLATMYFWAYTPMQLPVGIILDRFGARKILTLACLICAVGAYGLAVSGSLLVAKIGGACMGFGSAFAYVGVLKLASSWLDRKYFSLVAGIATALGMVGGMTGKVFMSYCVENVGWQKTLVDAGLLGIGLAIILLVFVRDPKKIEAQVDYKNFWRELVQVMKVPAVIKAGIIGGLMWLPLSIFADLWAMPFLEQLGLSRTDAAVIASLVSFGYLIGAPIWGFVSYRIESRKYPLIVGGVVSSVLALAIMQIQLAWLPLCMLMFALGFMASAQSVVFAIGNDLCTEKLSGTAASYVNFLVMLSSSCMPIVGFLITNYSISISVALLILPIALFVAFLLSLSLKETYRG